MSSIAPAQTSPVRKTLSGLLVLGGLLLALALVAIVLPSSGRGIAVWAAREDVKERLVSPGSASFKSSKSLAHTVDDVFHVVHIAVDSENRLGATLRSHFLYLMMVDHEDDDAQSAHVVQLTGKPKRRDVVNLSRELGEDWRFSWDEE